MMEAPPFHYRIHIERMEPFRTGERFAAKAVDIVRHRSDVTTERIPFGPGEVYGRTESEAEAKVQAAMQKWAAAQT